MDDRKHVRRAYDDVAETYAEERSPDEIELEILERLLGQCPDSARILDVGCGHGAPILTRIARAAEATGVDVSRGQLALAADNAPTAALLQGDMTALPVRNETFDVVTAFHSLIHVPLQHHQRVLEELTLRDFDRNRKRASDAVAYW